MKQTRHGRQILCHQWVDVITELIEARRKVIVELGWKGMSRLGQKRQSYNYPRRVKFQSLLCFLVIIWVGTENTQIFKCFPKCLEPEEIALLVA